MPLPKSIENAPELFLGLELYLDGFLNLCSTRSSGWGPGHLSWSVIRDYCEKLELDEDQTHAMHHHLRRLDEVYLRHVRENK